MPSSPSQSALYSEKTAREAGLTLQILGIASWEPLDIIPLQKKIKATADGWFGPQSVAAWKVWAKANQPNPVTAPPSLKGQVIINGKGYEPPKGVYVVNFGEPGGIPAQLDDTNERKHPVTQFVIHRGAEQLAKGDANYAAATERVLDSRGLSTTFTMDVDGTIYQHFDPGLRRGRHASWHNVQSDSIDIGGPFDAKTTGPLPSQKLLKIPMAIGRANDKMPPLTRRAYPVSCWSMTQAQVKALAAFIPWYCQLRGIPVTACDDWRCFRLSGGLGLEDPVTNVKGILAHTQISDPGQRVDGCMELQALKDAGAAIQWRSGADFFKT